MTQIDTWAKIQNEEDVMNDHHAPFWRAMIRQMSESDIHNSSVLDFGCNQGGFLRTLFRIKPFKKDWASTWPSNRWKRQKSERQHAFALRNARNSGKMDAQFDIAFSHDVFICCLTWTNTRK